MKNLDHLIKEPEELNNVINTLDPEDLKQILAYLLKLYVLEGGIQSSEGQTRDLSLSRNAGISKYNEKRMNFTEWIQEMKNKFQFPELNLFSIENNKVYLTLGGKKELLSIQDTNIIQKNDQSDRLKEKNKEIKRENSDKDNSVPSRFKNLEMDHYE